MRADSSKGIYAAEAEAKAIAGEAYAEASKGSPYEDRRQEDVARFVTKLAERLSRTVEQSVRQPAAPGRKPKRPQQESATIRRNVRITEGGTGRITVIHD
jgi:hypothetical protein